MQFCHIDDIISSPYIVGEAVWIKSLHGRYMTQFDRGTVTRICSPYSVCVDGIPHYVKDVCPVHRKNNTASDHVTPLDPSNDEADPMVYKAVKENSSASSAPSCLRQDEFSDMSENNLTEETKLVPLRQSSEQEPEICTTKATRELAPLRQSGWKKTDLFHIVLYVILKSGRSVMVMSRISMRNLFIEEAKALGLLAFFTIAELVAGEAHNMVAKPRMAVRMCSRTNNKACANANYGQLKIHKRSQNFSLCLLFVEA